MNSERQVVWLRYAEAYQFANGISELDRRQFVLLGLSSLRLHLSRREQPVMDFDLLFFAKSLSQMFESRGAITSILAGEDLRWWPDDDDGSAGAP